jgi:polysaccharide biosynthesis protein VpsQ
VSSSNPRRAAVGTKAELLRLPPQRPFRRWIPFIIALAIVVGAILAADFHRARVLFDWITAHPGTDKVGHFFLLGSLALTLNLGLRGRIAQVGPLSAQMGGLIVGALITLEEISQLWIPSRQFDLGDLAANYAGIAFADWLARRWLR